MTSKQKVINRENVGKKNLNKINHKSLFDGHILVVLTYSLSILLVLGAFNIASHMLLTNRAHKAYVLDKQIKYTLREIDSMKSELLENTNIISVQSESSNNGFVFNNDLKFVK